MSDLAKVVPPVSTEAAKVELHPSDAANLAAVEAAGVDKASDLGGFHSEQVLSDVELLKRQVDLLSRQMQYLRDTYVREQHFPLA